MDQKAGIVGISTFQVPYFNVLGIITSSTFPIPQVPYIVYRDQNYKYLPPPLSTPPVEYGLLSPKYPFNTTSTHCKVWLHSNKYPIYSISTPFLRFGNFIQVALAEPKKVKKVSFFPIFFISWATIL